MENLNPILGAVEELDKYGDLMTIKRFIEGCECGEFTDYDGHGHLVLNNKMNGNIFILPSQILFGEYDKRFTHIIWYNK